MGIRIDALDAGLASRGHEVPAMKDGATVRLTVGQLLDLLIDGAPGTLDTLNEIAEALNDDANLAATLTAAIAEKLDILQPMVDFASSSTMDIGTANSQNLRVTGTVGITSYGTSSAGTFRRMVHSSALTITRNATSLETPSGQDITVKAGDEIIAISRGAGNWTVLAHRPAKPSSFTYSQSQVSTSLAARSFTSIPSDAEVIQVVLSAVSTSGASPVCLQLGTSSGYVTSGYTSVADAVNAAPGVTAYTNAFAIEDAGTASTVRSATVWLTRVSGNEWVMSSSGVNNSPGLITGGGTISLGGALDRVQVTTIGGTDTFDAGNIAVRVIR